MMELFKNAADYLMECQSKPHTSDNTKEHQLLLDLGYLSSVHEPQQDKFVQQVRLLRAAAKMNRVFPLPIETAPRLIFLAGEASPLILGVDYADQKTGNIAGSGLTLKDAFESCVGEGVEYLSQFEQMGDTIEANAEQVQPDLIVDEYEVWPDLAKDAWVIAYRLKDYAKHYLPAQRCLRRQALSNGGEAPFAMGTGCGAGSTLAAATLHGLLELIERDAVSLWWRGGNFGRPLTLDSEAIKASADFLAKVRGGVVDRCTWLLDITSDLDIPCIAALSTDRNGKSFACGTAARTTQSAAAIGALKEMCHGELAHDVVAAKKQERGETVLNETDLRHEVRAQNIDAADCLLLHPRGVPVTPRSFQKLTDTETVSYVAEHLATRDIDTYAVDLTRSCFGIPVIRVVAPGLQLEPNSNISQRLARTIERTGGGNKYTSGISLF